MQLFLTYLKKHKKKDRKLILQWECDYLLNPFDKYHIMNEYMQMSKTTKLKNKKINK